MEHSYAVCNFSTMLHTFQLWVDVHIMIWRQQFASQWRHNERYGVSNHQPHGCLLNRLFRRRSKKTSKVRVNGLCAGNSPMIGEFPAQRASNAENGSIWWRHHGWRLPYFRSHPMCQMSTTAVPNIFAFNAKIMVVADIQHNHPWRYSITAHFDIETMRRLNPQSSLATSYSVVTEN